MIHCIEIPHQRPANWITYHDRAALVEAAMENDGWFFNKAMNYYVGDMPRLDPDEMEAQGLVDPLNWDTINKEVPNELSFAEAVQELSEDLNRMLVIETRADLDWALVYSGHQEIAVRAIAKQIDPETLLP